MATNTSIDIKSANGTTLLSTPINNGAKGYYSLMQHDYIVLPFRLRTPIDFKIGSYADLRGVFDDALGGKLAKMYYVTEPQNPTYNTSTGAYEYNLRLNAYYWLWNNFIFKYTPESTAGEASWSLTAPLDVQLGVFLRNLSALGFTYNGVPYEYSIDPTVENKAVAMAYDNTHLLDALFSMGGENAWDCDVWVTENVIHFGRCEHGDAVKMEIGPEASDMTRNESKGTFATRIYAFGSTRNIPANYRENDNPDLTVNGIVQKRLMLPSDTPYIDAYPDMQPFEPVESVVVFDDIYPKRVGTLSDVRTVDRAIEDENGEQTGTFKAYQYRDTGLTFDEKYRLEGQELRIVFQSGKLNGLDFGAIFNPNDSDPAEQLWEIEANEDYGRRLPDEVMKPENGDKYILYGFDIKMVSDLYIPEAEQELKKKAQKYIDSTKIDDGTYTATLRASYVRGDMIGRTYDVGQKVKLVNPAFFGTEGRVSRIIGWEMCLDIPSDNPIYTIGESAQYSRLTEIEDKVDSLTFNGQAYQGTGSGRGVYLITTNDSTPASNSNAYSALRARATFLLKDREDTTNYLLNLLGGIISPFLTSPDFISGALGTGFTVQRNADGTTYAEFDKILVRMKAVFQMLEILKADVAGGEIVINSGPRMKVTRVERTGNVPAYFSAGQAAYFTGGERAYFASSYRLYFLADDGDTAVQNLFHVGDLARCQTFDIREGVHENVSNRFWWRLVTAVGDDWIEVSSTVCAEGSDVPKEGDTVVQMGSDRDTDRQALVVLSAYGQGAPSFTMYQGIDSFSLSGKEIYRIGYNAAEGECEIMFGRNDGRGYMRYSPSKGLQVAGRIEVLGGTGLSSFDDAMDFAEQVNGSMAQYLGYGDWNEMVEAALKGNTVIRGGVINTSLINVSDLFAGDIYAGEATITKGRFKEIEVNDATITNSTLTDVTVTGTINANAGKIGGFTIRDTKLSYYYTEDGAGGQPSIVINASGSEFFRVNEIPTVDGQSNSSPFLHIRADRRPAIRVDTGGSYSDAPTGIRVTCNAAGYGKAIESYGNVLLRARDGENVKVNGLAMNVRQMSSGGNIGSSDDIIYTSSESDMTVYLPRSGHEGKVLFIRKCGNGNVTINGNGLRIMPSGRWTSDSYTDSYTIVNGNMCVLFCTGGIWIATVFG